MVHKDAFGWQNAEEVKTGSFAIKLVVLFVTTVLALSAGFLITNSSFKSALADSSSTETAQFNIKLETTGYTTGTTTSLDRTVNSNGDTLYTSNDHVILKWKGDAPGNDFVIPVSVRYGNKTVPVTELISNDQFQTLNSEYQRRMKSSGAIAEYNDIKNYILQEHYVDLGTAVAGSTVSVEYMKVSPVYRMYNMITSEHLFSTNKAEYDSFVESGKTDSDFWIGEGVNWLAPASSTTTVQRLYNAALGAMGHSSHYYTSNTTEMNNLINNNGWTSDGSANSFGSSGDVAIYTCYNEGLGSAHHYTSSKSEWQGLAQHGWALEEDKNEPNGNFQGILGTAWSFSNNFYTVTHKLENLDGSTTTYSNQVFPGVASLRTDAKALSIPGYKAGTIPNATISSSNTTQLTINYTRESYSINFDTNGGSAVQSIDNVKLGATLTAPATTPTKDGFTFKNWAFDRDGNHPINFDTTTYTMPVGGVTLFAIYEKNPEVQYTVKFEDADSHETLYTQTVVSGGYLTKVDDPTKSGSKFDAWYTSQGGTGTKWNFDTMPVTSDMTLYANYHKVATGETNTDGDATVIDPTTNKSTTVTVTYIDGTDTKKMSGAKVEIIEGVGIKVTAIADASKKTILVNVKDEDGPKDGISVNAVDADGNDRGTETTGELGNTSFDASRSKTGEDGQSKPLDPSQKDKNLVVSITYKAHASQTSKSTPLSDAVVNVAEDGKISVTLPDGALGKDVNVNVKLDDKAESNRSVTVTDSTGNLRGTKLTDTSGDAEFKANSATTDSSGIAAPSDPSDGDAILNVKVIYKNGTVDTPVEGASIVVEDNGSITVNASSVVKAQVVTVTVTKNGTGVANRAVTLYESSTLRDTQNTNNSGIATFDPVSGTTDDNGETELVDPSQNGDENIDKLITVRVSYAIGAGDYVGLSGAKVNVGSTGVIYVTGTEDSKGRDVRVEVLREGAGLNNKTVSFTDNDNMWRGTQRTANGGIADFPANIATTDIDGISTPTDPSDNNALLTVTVLWDEGGDGSYMMPLEGATVEVRSSSDILVTVPSDAQYRNVQVWVKKGKTPVKERQVYLLDSGQDILGKEKTDDSGCAYFSASKRNTNSTGGVEVINPKDNQTYRVNVTYDQTGSEYDKSSSANAIEVPLPEAEVEFDENGELHVKTPEEANGKSVTVQVTLNNRGAHGIWVSVVEDSGANRGRNLTDYQGYAFFKANSVQTGYDGTAKPVDPTQTSEDKQIDVKVEYFEDNEYWPMYGATVTVFDSGELSVTGTSDDELKDVKVTVTRYGTALEKWVTYIDSAGQTRDRKQTDKSSGEVIFEATTSTTNSSGIATPVDPADKQKLSVVVTYKNGIQSNVLSGAKVQAITGSDNKTQLNITDSSGIATGKDVTVYVKKGNDVVNGMRVNLTVADANRGYQNTDTSGFAYFLANSGITGGNGKVEPVDPSIADADNSLTVTVEHKVGDSYTALEGAKVTIDTTGIVSVEAPESAKGNDVRVTVVKKSDSSPQTGKQVNLTAGGEDRGSETTDAKGIAEFLKSSATTGGSGTVTPVDPSQSGDTDKDKTISVKVTYKVDDNYVPLAGAKVSIDSAGNVEVSAPEVAKAKDVLVNVSKADKAIQNKQVTLTVDSDPRGTKLTDDNGNAEFPANGGTTGGSGEVTPVYPSQSGATDADKLITVKVEYKADGANYEPLSGAEVTVDKNGIVSVAAPDAAKGKDVKVTITKKSDGQPATGKTVNLTAGGEDRGSATTDAKGVAEFLKSSGTTGGSGIVTPVDPSQSGDTDKDKTIVVSVKYKSDGENYVALSGAKVEVDSAGKVNVTAPVVAVGKDVLVNVSKNDKGIADKEVTLVVDNSPRGTLKTDGDGNAEFISTGGTTGTDGALTPVDPTDSKLMSVKVEYKSNGTDYVALAGAIVAVNDKGEIMMTVPDAATGKDVKVTVTKEDKGIAKKVTVVEATTGNDRGSKTTDSTTGVAEFLATSGTTGIDGTVKPTDPTQEGSDKSILVKVTYDSDGVSETEEEPLPGAIVSIAENGKVTVDGPNLAKGKDVTVTLSKDDKPIEKRDVTLTVVSADRGTVQTDNKGVAKFPASGGTTGETGTVTPVDPTDKDNLLTVLIESRDDSTSAYAPLLGANVTVDSTGVVNVASSDTAKGKDVRVTVKKNGNAVPNRTVKVAESDNNIRGIKATDKDGIAEFLANSGTTGSSGETTTVDPSDSNKRITIGVEYKENSTYTALEGANVSVATSGTISVEGTKIAKGKDVRVTVKDSNGKGINSRNVSYSDYDGVLRDVKQTANVNGTDGIAEFLATTSTTGSGGTATPTDPTRPDGKQLLSVSVAYKDPSATEYTPLAGAKVSINSTTGEVSVEAPDAAKAKDVRVQVTQDNTAVTNRSVALTVGGDDRGVQTTDNIGYAYFSAKSGTTGSGGTVSPVDPSRSNEVISVKVEYKDDSKTYQALSGAKVEVTDTGAIKVVATETAKARDIKVTVKDSADKGIKDKSVTVSETSGNIRGTKTTPDSGEVEFPATEGATGPGGTTTPVDPSQTGTKDEEKMITVSVTYTDESGKEVKMEGAVVSVSESGEISVIGTEVAKSRDVKVTVSKGSSMLDKKKVTYTDYDGMSRGTTETDESGTATFKANKATTNSEGVATPTDTDGKLLTVKVTYKDGETATNYANATVEVDATTGEVFVTGSDVAKNKEVTVNVKKENTAVNNRKVHLQTGDADRGEATTNESGDAVFAVNKGETDGSGTSKPVDPTNNKEMNVKVTYNEDDSENTDTLVALSGASVEVASGTSTVNVAVPAKAASKTVKVELSYADNSAISTSEQVKVSDEGSTERGTKTIASDSSATFAYYNVKFDVDGGSEEAKQKVYEHQQATQPAQESTKVGNDFKNWVTAKDGSEAFVFTIQSIDADTTVYAKWELQDRYVTFVTNTTETSYEKSTVKYGQLAKKPADTDPTRLNYNFAGWYSDSRCTVPFDFNTMPIYEDITLYANWTAKDEYTVSFNLQGGSNNGSNAFDTQYIKQGYLAKQPVGTPTKEGFDFKGWYDSATDGNVFNFETHKIEANTIVYAQWTDKVYTVTFDNNDGSGKTTEKQVTHGTTTTKLDTDPTRDGYTFAYWYDADDSTMSEFSFSTPIKSNKTLKAKWNPRNDTKYTVIHKRESADTEDSYDDETLWEREENQIGTTEQKTTAANKTDSKYDGFEPQEIEQQVIDGNGSTEVVVKYKRVKNTVKYHIVNSKAGTIETTEVANQRYGTHLDKVEPKLSGGYTFEDWWSTENYDTGSRWDFATSEMTKTELNLYAKWSPITYKVVYDQNHNDTGSFTATEETATYDADFTITDNKPTRYGYDFKGWTLVQNPSDDETVYASNTKYSAPNWKNTQDDTVTLYAKWTNKFWSVTYSPGKDLVKDVDYTGDVKAQNMYYLQDFTVASNEFTRPGYNFVNWKLGDTENYFTAGETSVIRTEWKELFVLTMNAQWTPIKYNVAFAGGAEDATGITPTQVATYNETLTLPESSFTRAGYTFIGWEYKGETYQPGQHSEEALKKLTTAENETITFTAKWQANDDTKYTVIHEKENRNVVDDYSVEGLWEYAEKQGTTDTLTPTTDLDMNYAGYTVQDIQPVNISGDGKAQLEVHYRRNSYEVTFNIVNEEAGSIKDGEKTTTQRYDTHLTEVKPTVNKGWTFGGWWTTSDYQEGTRWYFDSNTMTDKPLQLYAKWEPNGGINYNIVHIRENLQGNYEETDTSLTETTHLTGTTSEETKAKDNTISYEGFDKGTVTEAKIKGDGTTTVKVYYARLSYTVNFVAGTNGTVNQATYANQKYGSTITQPTDKANAGYTFNGWHKDSASGKTWVFQNDVMPAGELTLYADWTPNTNTSYSVVHKKEGYTADDYSGNGANLTETEYKQGTTDTKSPTDGLDKNYNGFTMQQITPVNINGDGKAVLEVKYKRNIHTITFNAGEHGTINGKTSDKLDKRYGYTLSTDEITVVPNAGYEFEGWYIGSESDERFNYNTTTMPDENITLVAKWSPKTVNYKVLHIREDVDGDYKTTGNLVEEQTLTGTTGTNTAAQARTYNGFITPTPDVKTIDGNGTTVVEIKYPRQTFTITLDGREGAPTQQTVSGKYETTVSKPTDPTPPAGYDFDKWYKDSERTQEWIFDSETVPLNGTTIYAGYKARTDTKYSVVHKRESLTTDDYATAYLWETESQKYEGETGKDTTATHKDTTTGTYKGWSAVEPITQKSITGDGLTSVDVLYKRNTYKLTLNAGDHGTLSTTTYDYKYEAQITYVTPNVAAGYDFKGWFKDDGTQAFVNGQESMPSDNMTLTARYEARNDTKYQVRYTYEKTDGTMPEVATSTDIETFNTGTTDQNTKVTPKTVTGFKVKSFEDKKIEGNGTTVVDVLMEREKYNVTLADGDHGTVGTKSITGVRYGATITETITTTPSAGYSFLEWRYTEDSSMTWNMETSTMPASDLSLTAYWATGDTTYKVTHKREGVTESTWPEELTTTQTVPGKTEDTTKAAANTYPGFTTPTTIEQKTIEGSGNTEVVIEYKRKSYDVTFNAQGGTGSPDKVNARFESSIAKVTEPTKQGYVFAGWYTDNTTYTTKWTFSDEATPSTVPENGITLYAKWENATNTAYKVKHVREDITENDYSQEYLTEYDEKTGTTNSTTDVKSFAKTSYGAGYEVTSVEDVTITADGKAVATIKYKRKSFDVNFIIQDADSKKGTVENKAKYTRTVRFGTLITQPSVFSNAGYKFDNWYQEEGFVNAWSFTSSQMPERDVTLYAKFSNNENTEYTVRHVKQNADGTYSTDYVDEKKTGTTDDSSKAVAKDVSTDTNYDGFNAPTSADVEKAQKTIAGDGQTVVTLQYPRKTWKVTYSAGFNGKLDKTEDVSVRYGDTLTAPTPTPHAGYEFNNWTYVDENNNTVQWSFDTAMPNRNITITANWTALEVDYTVKHYQQNLDGATYPDEPFETVPMRGKTADQTNAVAKTYDGFTVNNSWQNTTIGGDGKTVVSIYYTRNKVTATYSSGIEGVNISPTSTYALFDTVITNAPSVTRPGYKLIGWKWSNGTDSGDWKFGESKLPNKNITITAQWQAESVEYQVRHMQQTTSGGENYVIVATDTNYTGLSGSQTQAKANTYTGFDSPTAEELAAAQTTIDGNGTTVVDLKYKRQTFTITFDANGHGTVAPTYRAGLFETTIVAPTRNDNDGYTFVNWTRTDTGAVWDFSTTTIPAQNVTIRANWKANERTKYTVNHYLEGEDGNYPTSPTYTDTNYGQTDTQTNAVERTDTGYSVDTSTDKKWSNVNIDGDGNAVVNIYYKRNTHTVTFSAGDGVKDATNMPNKIDSQKYGIKLSGLSTPQRAGYTFLYWTYNGAQWNLSSNTMTNEDITLVAAWKSNTGIQYTVKHWKQNVNDNQFTEVQSDRETLTGTTNELTEAKSKGYAGFSVQNISQKNIEGNGSTVVDVYYDRLSYDVNFNTSDRGSSSIQKQTLTFENTVVKPENPVATGYTFDGWYTSNDEEWKFRNESNANTVPVDGITLYAKWTPITYNVKYDKVHSDATFVETTDTATYDANYKITTNVPNYYGYYFEGWSTVPNATTTDTIYKSGATVTTPNWKSVGGETITLYAQYSAKFWIITYSPNYSGANFGSDVMKSHNVKFGETLTPKANEFTRTGYKFVNWKDSKTGDVYTSGVTTTVDKELSGDWNLVNNSVTLNAQWEAIKYKLKFVPGDGAEGTAFTQEETYDGNAITLPGNTGNFKKAGYTFNGWIVNGTRYDAGLTDLKNLASNEGDEVVVTASWTEAKDTHYTVEHRYYNADDDGYVTETDDRTGTTGAVVTYDTKLKPGFNAPTTWDSNKTIAADGSTVVVLTYGRMTYTVSFEPGTYGSGHQGSRNYKAGQTWSLFDYPLSTDVAYEQSGWLFSGDAKTYGNTDSVSYIPTKDLEHVTMTAQWQIKKFDVKFDANGGTFSNGTTTNSQTIEYGSTLSDPGTPTQNLKDFMGWYIKGTETKFELSTAVKESYELEARWQDSKKYTIVLHANNGTNETKTIDRERGDNLTLEGNPFTYTDSSGNQHGFVNWSKGTASSTDTVEDKYLGDLATTAGEVVNLYANWTTQDISTYWIAPASKITTSNTSANQTNAKYTNPETGVVKTRDQIQADIKSIQDGDTTVKEQYTNWMNTDSMHLYTKLDSKVATGEDQYVEMRIIQVGSHQSIGNHTASSTYNDGTALTFQAIHSIPVSFVVNNTNASNSGGWKGSALRYNINSPIVLANYNTTLTSDVHKVQKWNKSEYTTDATMTSTNDSLWLLSASEIGGASAVSSVSGANKEGQQYDYWSKVIGNNSAQDNAALTALGETRSGKRPGNNSGYWWTRTVGTASNTFLSVNNSGNITANQTAVNTQLGTVPAFAFGTTTNVVTFDTQDSSTDILTQEIPTGGFAEMPSTTPVSNKAGYQFKGWYTAASGGKEFNFDTEAINGPTTVYAQYEPTTVNYNVDIYLESETVESYPTTASKTVKLTGKTGENTDANTVTPEEGYEIVADKTTTAQISGEGDTTVKVYMKRKSYQVKFNVGNLDETEKESLSDWPADLTNVRFGTRLNIEKVPYTTFYDHNGWCLEDGTKIDTYKYTMPAGDITLKAEWIRNTQQRYKIEEYLMDDTGTNWTYYGYTLGQGAAGDNTEYDKYAPLIEGYHFNREKSANERIQTNHATTIKVYYDRNVVNVEYVYMGDDENNSKKKVEKVFTTQTGIRYGQTLTDPTPYNATTSEYTNNPPTARGVLFDGWLSDGYEDDGGTKIDFNTYTVPANIADGGTLKIYAKMKGKELWMAAASTITTSNSNANQTNPAYTGSPVSGEIIKTAEEIDSDMKVLHAGETNARYAAVKAEYESYMTTDSVHLYTNWIGSSVDSSGEEQEENEYLEFRIIQVGEHDGDGSAVTFQMTHTIPTAFNISSSETTAGGWEGSPLRTKIASFAPTYEKFTGTFHEIEKKTYVSGTGHYVTDPVSGAQKWVSDSSGEVKTTKDKFWLMSYYEMMVDSGDEGSRYAWYKNLGLNILTNNANPAVTFKTRAGNNPYGETGNNGGYWMRTPNRNDVSKQMVVDGSGRFLISTGQVLLEPNKSTGVVICFAF